MENETPKLSPAPWILERLSRPDEDDGSTPIFGVSHQQTVCDETTVCNLSNEADARLIAAAPELLEALRYVRRFVGPKDVDTAWVDSIIAKATEVSS